MTREDYIAAGFPLSVHVTEEIIKRAEADIKEAYIFPIDAAADVTTGTAKKVCMQAAWTLILYRSVVATRAGAKIKESDQSQSVDMTRVLQQESRTTALWVEKYAKENSALLSSVTDILGIFFTTNFIGG